MSSVQAKYRWSDAWLLASIGMASSDGPAELHQIIAAGDASNHAIFTQEEFESGLCRLVNGGWIEEINGRFKLTEKLKKNRKGFSLSMERIEGLLNAGPWSPGESIPHPNNNLHYPGFSVTAFSQAIEKYHKEFWKD